jgi:hypothetical protein
MKIASVVILAVSVLLVSHAGAETPRVDSSSADKAVKIVEPSNATGATKGFQMNLSTGFDANRPLYLPRNSGASAGGMPVRH